jgi:hypothetical protein
MKTIRHVATLFYYDGPQVFEARDAIGGQYVAVMVEPQDGHDRYLVAGVEPGRLSQFRSGKLDLRDLLVERVIDEWFLSKTDSQSRLDSLTLESGEGSLEKSSFLPHAGFFLKERSAEGIALQEARARIPKGSDSITLLGTLEEADMARCTWRIATQKGKYSGEVRDGGPSLAGLRLGSPYRFSCIEQVEQAEWTGREQRTLFLIDHQPA